MSVPRAQRNESEMEFLHNARTLLTFTLRKCKKLPKRFTFSVTNKITDLAWDIFGDIKQGNSIYPTNQHEVQLRRDCFLRARAKLYDLVGKVEVAAEFAPIEGEVMKEWMSIVHKEIALIKGVLDSDKKRYKNLNGTLTLQDAYNSFQSWKSHAERFNAYHTIKNMELLYNELFNLRR